MTSATERARDRERGARLPVRDQNAGADMPLERRQRITRDRGMAAEMADEE